MTALSPAEVAARVGSLRSGSGLTELQAARLSAIVRILDESGRFLLRSALDAAEFPTDQARGQDAFQDFRKRVNDAAAAAGVDLRLELEARKSPPERRYGWFAGGDLVDEGIAAFTGKAADNTGIAYAIAPEVTELGASRRTRVYVSIAATDAATRSARQVVERLGQHLQLDGDRRWEIADPDSIGPGEDLETTPATRTRWCGHRTAPGSPPPPTTTACGCGMPPPAPSTFSSPATPASRAQWCGHRTAPAWPPATTTACGYGTPQPAPSTFRSPAPSAR